MEEIVTFPRLGLEFTIHPVAFTIGNFSFKWYGIIIAVGLLLAVIYGLRRAPRFGLDPDRVIDVILAGTVGGIVGARLYYVAFTWDYYKDNLGEIFKIWNGGIAIYGGIIGAFLVGTLFCKLRKVKILPMYDLAAGGFLIGQAIGRWGNFINVEAFGGNTDGLLGMTSPKIESYLRANMAELSSIGMQIDPTQPVHPTFLYESLWCALGFIIVLFLTKHRRFDGSLFLFYIGWYSLGRYNIEGLRTDSLMWGNYRVSQMLALFVFVAAILAWLVVRIMIFRKNDPDFLKLYVLRKQEQAPAAETAGAAAAQLAQGDTDEQTAQTTADEDALGEAPADEEEKQALSADEPEEQADLADAPAEGQPTGPAEVDSLQATPAEASQAEPVAADTAPEAPAGTEEPAKKKEDTDGSDSH